MVVVPGGRNLPGRTFWPAGGGRDRIQCSAALEHCPSRAGLIRYEFGFRSAGPQNAPSQGFGTLSAASPKPSAQLNAQLLRRCRLRPGLMGFRSNLPLPRRVVGQSCPTPAVRPDRRRLASHLHRRNCHLLSPGLDRRNRCGAPRVLASPCGIAEQHAKSDWQPEQRERRID